MIRKAPKTTVWTPKAGLWLRTVGAAGPWMVGTAVDHMPARRTCRKYASGPGDTHLTGIVEQTLSFYNGDRLPLSSGDDSMKSNCRHTRRPSWAFLIRNQGRHPWHPHSHVAARRGHRRPGLAIGARGAGAPTQ